MNTVKLRHNSAVIPHHIEHKMEPVTMSDILTGVQRIHRFLECFQSGQFPKVTYSFISQNISLILYNLFKKITFLSKYL
ncbi:hypothetical protein O3M35_006246 [Rhynocoris fuscipes]|uniref:Uncharacterized protein n=1 Tax=Rhynocoris fuscipes TaxID=488301 RepID=A0AAW1DIJ7_9HEMI